MSEEKDEQVKLTAAQAISVLPEGERVHTFLSGMMLIGADWDRANVIKSLEGAKQIELTGKMARSMKHGICFWEPVGKKDKDGDDLFRPVFIETDEEKLQALEKTLAPVSA